MQGSKQKEIESNVWERKEVTDVNLKKSKPNEIVHILNSSYNWTSLKQVSCRCGTLRAFITSRSPLYGLLSRREVTTLQCFVDFTAVCWCTENCALYKVTRSRKIESDGDYQKNKERVQELKVLWKKETLYSTNNNYIETFDINMILSVYFTNSHF